MKKAIREAILGVILLAMCLSSMSCYTVVRRPEKVISEEDRYLGQEYYGEDWVEPGYLWYDPYYHWYYPDAYSRWRYYYTYPWWWNDYWFWHGDGEALPVDTDRHIWDGRREPDWSSPPSTPVPSTSASQPRQGQQRSQENSPSVDTPKNQSRRKPEWGQQPSHSPPADQRSKDREQQGEVKEADQDQ